MAMQPNAARHRRARRSNEQVDKILNACAIGRNVQGHSFPRLSFFARNRSIEDQSRMVKLRRGLIEKYVAIGSVDDGPVRCTHLTPMAGVLHLKIRYAHSPAGIDTAKLSAEFSLRIESAADYWESGKIGIAINVLAMYRCNARLFRIPRAPCSHGTNLSWQIGIVERHIKGNRRVGSYVMQRQPADAHSKWPLFRSAGLKFQKCAVCKNNADGQRCCRVAVGKRHHRAGLAGRLAGRNDDVQTDYPYHA